MSCAQIDKTTLFDRLGRAGAALTVVTPNRRLALELGREFAASQMANGRTVWEAEDVVPLSAFVARAYEDALYSDLAADLPVLLTPAQEQALWETILGRSEQGERLMALPLAAAAASDAWQRAHGWRLLQKLRHGPLNEDAEAFTGWAQRYERWTREQGRTDVARLTDVVIGVLGHPGVARPALLVRYGFDIVTPQQQALFDALAAQGCEIAACSPPVRDSAVLRVECSDERDELRRVAQWARARLLANGQARIGVVVPDLARRRFALQRIFTQTLAPAAPQAPPRPAPQAPPVPAPFNLSLGEPLTAFALVDAAFQVLELAGRDIEFERLSLLIRSPFIAAGEAELASRARLDAALRKRAEPVVSLDRLAALLAGGSLPPAPVFAQRIALLAEFRKARLFGAQAPEVWARAFGEALALVGFPGERALDSAEYQTLKKWHEALAQLAQLGPVVARIGFAESLGRLRRIAADTAFQPESADVPVQVLGVLESAGCVFDHLWVCGLTSEAWPLVARPNPFLPLRLQREAGIPESSAAASLELDRKLTQGWLGSAGEVVLSHATRDADREITASPLIAMVPAGEPALPAGSPDHAAQRDAIFAGRRIERLEDAQGPAAGKAGVRGGTAIIKDQSACPFRAFAAHRLEAEGLTTPHPGLDALERGALVHGVLAAVWSELRTKSTLDGIAEAQLQALLERAAAAAVERQRRDRPAALAGRFALIEQRRLARLARDWLELEKGRGDFSVLAVEVKRDISIGEVQLRGRLDRVDATATGQRIVIDYKTGAPGVGSWLGARPQEPQLPLYLVAAEPDATAIAYGQVKTGAMQFVTLASDGGVLPGARSLPDARLRGAARSWGEQVDAWRAELERLAQAFASGAAAVDPYPGACDYCDFKPLCRIHARTTDAEPDADS